VTRRVVSYVANRERADSALSADASVPLQTRVLRVSQRAADGTVSSEGAWRVLLVWPHARALNDAVLLRAAVQIDAIAAADRSTLDVTLLEADSAHGELDGIVFDRSLTADARAHFVTQSQFVNTVRDARRGRVTRSRLVVHTRTALCQ
jgi:hypothetical protein